MDIFIQTLAKMTAQAAVIISDRKGYNFTKQDLASATPEIFKRELPVSIKIIQEDAKRADLMGGLERKKPVIHELVRTAATISIRAEAVRIAEIIVQKVLENKQNS